MKKFASLFLATVVTVAVLTGCGSNGTLGSTSGSGASGSGTSSNISEGRFGDTMHTYFFDYTVNSAYLCDEYEGYTPQSGNELLVADVTVKNTTRESIEMYDTDFQVQWNDTSDEAFDFPITYAHLDEGEVLGNDMLPGIYELSINQSVNGLLVFEVPEGNKDFSISYLEMFDNGEDGDLFFVYFSAEKK